MEQGKWLLVRIDQSCLSQPTLPPVLGHINPNDPRLKLYYSYIKHKDPRNIFTDGPRNILTACDENHHDMPNNILHAKNKKTEMPLRKSENVYEKKPHPGPSSRTFKTRSRETSNYEREKQQKCSTSSDRLTSSDSDSDNNNNIKYRKLEYKENSSKSSASQTNYKSRSPHRNRIQSDFLYSTKRSRNVSSDRSIQQKRYKSKENLPRKYRERSTSDDSKEDIYIISSGSDIQKPSTSYNQELKSSNSRTFKSDKDYISNNNPCKSQRKNQNKKIKIPHYDIHCEACNILVNSEEQFDLHINSKKHKKKVELRKKFKDRAHIMISPDLEKP